VYSVRGIREPAVDLYVHLGRLGMGTGYMHCVEQFKQLRIVQKNLCSKWDVHLAQNDGLRSLI
jgi:hypothetical protein